jgi:hypothetical protein
MKGYVYVLSNPSMPGLRKIGETSKDPKGRAAELSKDTGVPIPFVLEYEAHVENPRRYEQSVHKRLQKKRYGKEFFKCSFEEAIIAIKDEVGSGLIYEVFHKARREEIEESIRKDREQKIEVGNRRNREKGAKVVDGISHIPDFSTYREMVKNRKLGELRDERHQNGCLIGAVVVSIATVGIGSLLEETIGVGGSVVGALLFLGGGIFYLKKTFPHH